ncbi:MAG: PEP-utilizing enzyme [Bacteroidetes bacterium]|nr:PEP-utilizing enzyme [Bacteroidota bacterium]
MADKFISKALEANLAETRYKNIVIPESHQFFITLSESYYGISKRASECLIEYSHPFSNRKFVVEQLREILLGDFWFYFGNEQAEKAFDVILDVQDKLLQCDLKKELHLEIIQTLIEFVELLSRQRKILHHTISECLHIFKRNLELRKESFIESSRFFIKHLTVTVQLPSFCDEVFRLTQEILYKNILFWEQTSQINAWMNSRKQILRRDYSAELATVGQPYFDALKAKIETITDWQALTTEIPTYDAIADNYSRFTDIFESFIEKFYYSFYLLYLPGMAQVKDRLIWNINKLLRNTIDEIEKDELKDFTDKIFELSEQLRKNHMSSVLDCLLTLGKKLIDVDDTEERQLVSHFESKLIDFGFEIPGIVYVNEDWQINVNPNHIKNIRVWLELIEYPHMILERLLSSLIVNLKLGGIFINDTDLFQRDISKILNSNIAPYYKRVKQLTKIFPVYFNEIGAEGDIRHITTSIDELSRRQDRLIHFLRKQVHTESNNTLIDLTRKIFSFWYDGDLSKLKPLLPSDVYESIDLEGEWFAPVHLMVHSLCEKSSCRHTELLDLEESKFEELIAQITDNNNRDKERIKFLRKLYFLLKEKYSFDTVDISAILKKFPFLDNKEIEKFSKALKSNNFEKSLKMIYSFMEKLKQIIFNPSPSEGWENIYYKRHIAIGIPSMYGVYRENKFEALGLTFRLEKIATRLMEKVVDNINLDYISAKTLNRIYEILEYFREGLEFDGIYSQGFTSNLEMLKYSLISRSFSLEQYINIFQFIAEDIKKSIDKYFLKTYEYPLYEIIPRLFRPENEKDEKSMAVLLNKKSEEFYRDIISSAFLVQPLDNLVSRVLHSLRNMADHLPQALINDVMSYNSDLVISPISEETVEMDNQIFLGSKGYFLKKMYLSEFPVPQGFVLTTEVFRCRNAISNLPDIGEEMDRMILTQIKRLEKLTGREFGNPKNPLLLSVRSGSAISMPGAMTTFLDVGMNDELTIELSKQHNFGWTSWDSYRRLLQCWGMANGIARDVFDQTIQAYKKKYKVDQKANFEPALMHQIAMAYKKVLSDNNIYFEQDLQEQLKQTISYVFESWSSERARAYRQHLGIANEWGTAVIIQKMILGNLHKYSGTGVVFTRYPHDPKPGVNLYGDFTFCSQGEDIVSGLVHTLPISENQRKLSRMKKRSLQSAMPEIYRRIQQIAVDLIENHGYPPQEIEFTFESENPNDVFILQTRDLDILNQQKINVFSLSPHDMQLVGRGIGIGGGAMNGILSFDMDDLDKFKVQFPGQNHILVRPDTVPDDIGMVFKCDGLLTSKGGATSHAAVTAVRLGKVCVVNCIDLAVNEKKKECAINAMKFKSGDRIAIDGYLGNIYKGNYPIELSELIPGI